MSRQLVSRNPDLARLVDAGYAVAFDSGYLVVRDIPYLDASQTLATGAIVTKLDHLDRDTVRQTDHQVFFAGGVPHALDGRPIANLGGGETTLSLSGACIDIVVKRSFSNKPPSGMFADFFEKIESYVSIISGPAIEKFNVTPRTGRAVLDAENGRESVFEYPDTLTSRSEIKDLSDRLAGDVLCVIGLGGTGAYVLDYLVRTPAHEIRGYDHDTYCVHNAYRSPGRLLPSELGRSKAAVYAERYAGFRRNLRIEDKFIDHESVTALDGVTFAFVCVDRGAARAEIFSLLIGRGIPFIDVGMGLRRSDGGLTGLVRTTYYSTEDAERTKGEGWAPLVDLENDLYRNNTQITELNALNAALAVIKYKQVRGFYHASEEPYSLLYDLGDGRIATTSRHETL